MTFISCNTYSNKESFVLLFSVCWLEKILSKILLCRFQQCTEKYYQKLWETFLVKDNWKHKRRRRYLSEGERVLITAGSALLWHRGLNTWTACLLSESWSVASPLVSCWLILEDSGWSHSCLGPITHLGGPEEALGFGLMQTWLHLLWEWTWDQKLYLSLSFCL